MNNFFSFVRAGSNGISTFISEIFYLIYFHKMAINNTVPRDSINVVSRDMSKGVPRYINFIFFIFRNLEYTTE